MLGCISQITGLFLVWCANTWRLSVSALQHVHKKFSGNCSSADYWCEAGLCGVQVVSRAQAALVKRSCSACQPRVSTRKNSICFGFSKASWRINSVNGVCIVMTRSYLHCGRGTRGHLSTAEWASLESVWCMRKQLPEDILVSKGVSLAVKDSICCIYLHPAFWIQNHSRKFVEVLNLGFSTPSSGFNLFSVPTELSRRHFKACNKIPFRACLETSVWKTLPLYLPCKVATMILACDSNYWWCH